MKTKIGIYIMHDTHDKLQTLRKAEGISMSVAIDRLIREKFDKEQKKKAATKESGSL